MSAIFDYDQFSELFCRGTDIDALLKGLGELEHLRQQSADLVTEKDYFELRLDALRTLAELTAGDNHRAETIIMDVLLPDLLVSTPENSMYLHKIRDLLMNWLDQYDREAKTDIRSKAIAFLLPALSFPDPRPACWAISRLGFRTPEICDRLYQIVRQRDDEIGDAALSVLTTFGLEDLREIKEQALRRATRRQNNHLLWTISRLGDIEGFSVILEHWLKKQSPTTTPTEPSLAFTAIRELLNLHDDEHDVLNHAWVTLVELVESNPGALYWGFDVGHIPSLCNSPLVIPQLMEWVGKYPNWFEKPAWARYLACLRAQDCVKPRQMEGWAAIEPDSIELLCQDALIDTGKDVFETTIEMEEKKTAWKTLLRAGYADALSWFDPAVTHETSRFSQQEMMNLLASFVVDPLPTQVIDWIKEEYDDANTGKDGREFARRMSAARMARSAATGEAFQALLNFGFTYQGKVILQSTDALSEAAIHLVRQGKTEIVSQLVDIVSNVDAKPHHRLAAANTLETLAADNPSTVVAFTERFIACVYDINRDPIERGLLLNAIGHLTNWDIPQALCDQMANWAHEPNQWIRGGSLYALANHGRLEVYQDIMSQVLGLIYQDGQWYPESEHLSYEWAPYTIGLLYYKNPTPYIPAVCSLIAHKDWHAPIQIMRWLFKAHSGDHKINLPGVIKDALMQRIRERQSAIYSEPEIFDLLASLAPEALVSEAWADQIVNWMPDLRVALANALGNTGLIGSLKTLELLAADGMFAVRRSSYRAIAKLSPEYLYSLCTSWAESPDLVQRSAEACGWIENVINEKKEDGFAIMYQRLLTHPEPDVRDAAKQSWEDRRKRMWARTYLAKVLGVRGSNEEILRTWCYGDALPKVGDDECLKELQKRLLYGSLPPNTRHWLEYIGKELDKNWKQVTQKWPEPWTDMKGALEQGKGKVILPQQRDITVEYSLWKELASTPSEKHSWGGSISSSQWEIFNVDNGVLEMEDGRKGSFWVKTTTGANAVIIGTGMYPEFIQEDPD